MTVGTDCDKGSYCEGSNANYPGAATKVQIRPTPCPAGTYGAPLGSSSVTACKACDAGKYCDIPGQIETGGLCEAGFICLTGNDRPGPYVKDYNLATSTSGVCNVGY